MATFQPLTEEQFNSAVQKFGVDQVMQFEKQRKDSYSHINEPTPESRGAIKQSNGTYRAPTFGEGLKQATIGAGNYFGKEAIGLGQYLLNTPERVIPNYKPIFGDPTKQLRQSSIQTGEDLKAQMNPKNQAQQGGATAAQVGEIALPLAKPIAGAIEYFPTILKGVSGSVKKAATTVSDIATSGKKLATAESGLEDLKNVKTDLSAQKAELPVKENTQTLIKNDINRSIDSVKAAKTAGIKDMTNTFKETNQTLQNTLQNKAELQTAQNKGTLKTLFKDMSDTYKSGLDQAEQAMAKRGATLKSSDFSKVIDDTLQIAKDYGVDVNDSTIKALKEVQAELAKGKPLSLDKLTVLKQKIYNASSMGKDFVNDEFMRNYGVFLEKYAPELKALNEEFAPMAQAKRWATKTFAPYDEAVIDKGAKVLTDLAKGEKPTQTTANYLKNLSEGSGSFKGAGDLAGETTKAGENIKVTEKMFNDAKNNLLTSTDKQLADLDTQLKQVEDKISSIKTEGKKLGKSIADQNALIKQQTNIVKRLTNLKKIRNGIIKSVFYTVAGSAVGGTIYGAAKVFGNN